MSRMRVAAERLANALDALEAAARPLTKARDLAQESAREAEKLGREREGLIKQIAALEEDTRAMAGLTEEIEDRLDGAIAEIRAALGR